MACRCRRNARGTLPRYGSRQAKQQEPSERLQRVGGYGRLGHGHHFPYIQIATTFSGVCSSCGTRPARLTGFLNRGFEARRQRLLATATSTPRAQILRRLCPTCSESGKPTGPPCPLIKGPHGLEHVFTDAWLAAFYHNKIDYLPIRGGVGGN